MPAALPLLVAPNPVARSARCRGAGVDGEIYDVRVGLVATGISFCGLLAVFSAIVALVWVESRLIEPGDLVAPVEKVAQLRPQEDATILLDQSREIARAGETVLTLTAAVNPIVAIYS